MVAGHQAPPPSSLLRRPIAGPTEAAKEELALSWESRIVPDSMPSGEEHEFISTAVDSFEIYITSIITIGNIMFPLMCSL